MKPAPATREETLAQPAMQQLASVWARVRSWFTGFDRSGSTASTPAMPMRMAPARRRSDAPAARLLSRVTGSASGSVSLPLPTLKTHRDALTGLCSRAYLDDHAQALLPALRSRGAAVCVLRVGLDGLDALTERYGPGAAEQVQQQMAKRLRQLARGEDLVMRLQDGEFALLMACPQGESISFARALASRVMADLKRPVSWRTLSNLHVGGCIGSAVWPADGSTLDEVMGNADEALAQARRSGSGQTRQFAAANDTIHFDAAPRETAEA